MSYKFTYPREKYDEVSLDKNLILKLILKHQELVEPLKKNKLYYDGKHSIVEKTRRHGVPNAKTVCNHAKDISDTATGYFMGNAISYNNTGDSDIEPLLVAFDKAGVDDTDNDLALDMSIYGVAYEYDYAKEGETVLQAKSLEPEQTFIVYDDTIEQNELFGVYYYLRKDDVNDKRYWYATVCTEHYIYELNIENNISIKQQVTEEPRLHNFDMMPIIEYQNNKENIGDFEQQISLIDAYNILMSDRVNDKEQFIDAILVLYGATLTDETEISITDNEQDEDNDEAAKALRALRRLKLLELPEDAKAEYLTRTLDETGVEILRKAIKEDIYTFSHVPNLTDENFVGNSSGVAMEYKLLGLEMITKVKQRYYTKGLRKRIKLFCNYLSLKQILVDADSIVPVFTRGLPKNILEIAQTITNLKGIVSLKTLLSMLPFVEDPDEELKNVREDNAESIKMQQELFNNTASSENTPPDKENKQEEEQGDLDE